MSSFLERRRQNGYILILSNTPVLDLHDPVRHMGKFEIVGDHDDGLMKLAAGLTQQTGGQVIQLSLQAQKAYQMGDIRPVGAAVIQ